MTYFRRMRKAFFLLFVAATACSRQADPVPVPPAPTHTVGWRVDGQDVMTDHYVSLSALPGSTLVVYGRDYANGSEVQLEMPGAVGTYTFGAGSPAWATYATRAGTKYAAGAAPGASGATGPGTVVLTALANGVAVGTFAFTGIDPVTKAVKSVTTGTFRVPI